MRPIVTDRPMLMTNSRQPYAMPSNRTPTKLVTNGARARYGCLPGSFTLSNLSNSTFQSSPPFFSTRRT